MEPLKLPFLGLPTSLPLPTSGALPSTSLKDAHKLFASVRPITEGGATPIPLLAGMTLLDRRTPPSLGTNTPSTPGTPAGGLGSPLTPGTGKRSKGSDGSPSVKGPWTQEEDDIVREKVIKVRAVPSSSRAVLAPTDTRPPGLTHHTCGRASSLRATHRLLSLRLGSTLLQTHPALSSRPLCLALVSLDSQYGTKRWLLVASHLNGRTGKQCRERWLNHLDPSINKGPWSPDEVRRRRGVASNFACVLVPASSPPPAPPRGSTSGCIRCAHYIPSYIS
jgi:myb proto-oncogene protein